LTALAFLGVNGKPCRENADIWSNNTVVANLDLAYIIDRAVASNDNVMANRDVVTVIANEGCLNSNMPAYAANIGDWGSFCGRNSNRITRLQNFEE